MADCQICHARSQALSPVVWTGRLCSPCGNPEVPSPLEWLHAHIAVNHCPKWRRYFQHWHSLVILSYCYARDGIVHSTVTSYLSELLPGLQTRVPPSPCLITPSVNKLIWLCLNTRYHTGFCPVASTTESLLQASHNLWRYDQSRVTHCTTNIPENVHVATKWEPIKGRQVPWASETCNSHAGLSVLADWINSCLLPYI